MEELGSAGSVPDLGPWGSLGLSDCGKLAWPKFENRGLVGAIV